MVEHIILKSNSGYQSLPLDSMLLAQRKIFVDETINGEYATSIIRQLTYLEDEDDRSPIRLYISSLGGECAAGLAIYDQLKGMTLPIEMYCVGMAASMAAVILAGGRKGHRFILPHSQIMLHEPLIDGKLGGSASSIQRTAEQIMETKKVISELLANDTGRSIAEIEKAIAFDNYMSAQQAIDFGLVDAIVNRV